MIRLARRKLVCSLLSIGAAAIAGAVPVHATAAEPIDQPLRALYDALGAVMRSGRKTPFTQRFDALAPVVDQVFDLETILKLSIGPRWNSLDADARKRLLRVFRRFTIATYAAGFDRYEGEHFVILPGSRRSGSDRVVATQIVDRRNNRVHLDYVMRDENGTWRAVDVLLDGSISRVAVQRSDFRKILANGDVEALIANLRHKTADLSDGAINS